MPAYRSSSLFIALTLLVTAAQPAAVIAEPPEVPTNTPLTKPAETLVPLNHLPALQGDYFKLHSETVDRAFHIYIRLPEGYDSNAETQYPVVYLLDGDSLFPILAANHLFLTYDDQLPEAIVVGIAYGGFSPEINKRHLDFTPGAADGIAGDGAAATFLQFLKHELLPEVESRYRADASKRVLFGQSRGGSMVLYSAFTEPDLFWGRIASNPAFAPGRELFFSAPAVAGRDDLRLMVTSGSADRPELRAAASEWFAYWRDRDNKAWQLEMRVIEGGTHAADSTASYRNGMRWLFQLADEQ
ncbi:alpha/beta hydrolase-fold protein [Alkalimonas collagenimarina]|uniref:Alpha/beta hydrolase-fold protein n=1 Tax=Alkalimonas collagenimarina TaxID=400390 RepID=A0ABT9GVQ0_9GAMM|nr:alpha/beta hydrolase-fold protein [Alkalimonas collagenimarina]MDP4535128.1 alpha/beta hydrolase-fold protein [Alkalimonas collagenimarina]